MGRVSPESQTIVRSLSSKDVPISSCYKGELPLHWGCLCSSFWNRTPRFHDAIHQTRACLSMAISEECHDSLSSPCDSLSTSRIQFITVHGILQYACSPSSFPIRDRKTAAIIVSNRSSILTSANPGSGARFSLKSYDIFDLCSGSSEVYKGGVLGVAASSIAGNECDCNTRVVLAHICLKLLLFSSTGSL